jgi:hypothetical protein
LHDRAGPLNLREDEPVPNAERRCPMKTTLTATRTDRSPTSAHGTVSAATRTGSVALAAKQRINGVAPMAAFGDVPSTYVADLESHPPREHPVA